MYQLILKREISMLKRPRRHVYKNKTRELKNKPASSMKNLSLKLTLSTFLLKRQWKSKVKNQECLETLTIMIMQMSQLR